MATPVHSHAFLIHFTKSYSAPLTASNARNTRTIKADSAIKKKNQIKNNFFKKNQDFIIKVVRSH